MKVAILFAFFVFSLININSFEEIGMASWYGPGFHGKKTANGEIFNTYSLTGAHKTLPLNSIVKVTSLENGKEVIVRINDRGPFAKGRVIDLSKAAAVKLGLIQKGTMKVKIELIQKGDNKYFKGQPSLFKIQVASYQDFNKAEKTKNNLISNGINAEIEESFTNNTKIFRVIVPNLTYTTLNSNKIKLHNAGYDNYLVRKQH